MLQRGKVSNLWFCKQNARKLNSEFNKYGVKEDRLGLTTRCVSQLFNTAPLIAVVKVPLVFRSLYYLCYFQVTLLVNVLELLFLCQKLLHLASAQKFYESRYLCWYGDLATDWTTEESWLDSSQDQEISPSCPGRSWGLPNLVFLVYRGIFCGAKAIGA